MLCPIVSESTNGTMIEEKFETGGKLVNKGFGFSRSQKVYRNPFRLEWFIKLLFPANTNHPVFMCTSYVGHSTYVGQTDALKTHFECGECEKADRI